MIKFKRTEEYIVCSPAVDTGITLDDLIKTREAMLMRYNEFTECFICRKKLDKSKIMHVAIISGVGNRCLCDVCADWCNAEWKKQIQESKEEIW